MPPKIVIPESKRAAVEKALSETLGVTVPDEIALLTGGLSTSLVYRIVIRGAPYVLRITMRTGLFDDPVPETACIEAAAAAGIAPPVLYANAGDGIVISQFIAAQPATGIPILTHLVRLIRSIHSLPEFPKRIDALDTVDEFIRKFQATNILPAAATAEHFACYAEIQRHYPRHGSDLVSSHNDLNPNNILFDGARFWIVDWEAASAGDRYVDLAMVANAFLSAPEAEEAFLRGYFEDALTDYHRARFFLMRQVCLICFASIFLTLAAAQKPADILANADMTALSLKDFYGRLATGQVALGSFDGQLLYAKVLLRQSLEMMKTPRFAESIERVRQ